MTHTNIHYECFSTLDGDTVLFSVISRKGLNVARVVFSEGGFQGDFFAEFSAYLVRRGIVLVLYNGLNTRLGNLFSQLRAKLTLKDCINYCCYPKLEPVLHSRFSFELGVMDYA